MNERASATRASVEEPDTSVETEVIVVPDEPPPVASDAVVRDELPAAEPPAQEPGQGGEVEVQCPGCGLLLVGESPRPTAAWFCPRCDYPLFWATRPAEAATPPSRAARRRLPGTGGREIVAAQTCWHCGELSEVGDDECRRCAATLPKPRAPRVSVPEPYPVPYPVAIRTVVWPFVAAFTLAGTAIAIVITHWLTGA